MKGSAEDNDIRFGVKQRLPHKDNMLLIDGIAYKKDNTVNLPMTVPSDSIFAGPNGVLSPLAMIEMIAQLCGAQYIFDNGLKDGQLCGYLVGIDNVVFTDPVYTGDNIDLIAWNILEMKEIQRIKGEIRKGGIMVGQCELTLFKLDEWDTPELAVKPEKSVKPNNTNVPHLGREKDRVSREILRNIEALTITSGESVAASFCLAPDFAGFSGHFPDYPVLPAVVTVYIGWLLAELCADKELDLWSIRRAKFLEPIHPNDLVDVLVKQIQNNPDDGTILYSVVMTCNGTQTAAYRLAVKPAAKKIGHEPVLSTS